MSTQFALEYLLFLLLCVVAASTLAIWIVGKLGLGLQVSGFGAAFIASLIILVLIFLITILLALLRVPIGNGLWTLLINLVASFIVLMLASRFKKGLRVNSIWGALLAAAAIAIITWLIGWLISP